MRSGKKRIDALTRLWQPRACLWRRRSRHRMLPSLLCWFQCNAWVFGIPDQCQHMAPSYIRIYYQSQSGDCSSTLTPKLDLITQRATWNIHSSRCLTTSVPHSIVSLYLISFTFFFPSSLFRPFSSCSERISLFNVTFSRSLHQQANTTGKPYLPSFVGLSKQVSLTVL